jgi:hypothetical protein
VLDLLFGILFSLKGTREMKNERKCLFSVLVVCLLVSSVSFGAMVGKYNGSDLNAAGGFIDQVNNQGIGNDALAAGDARPAALSTTMPNGTTRTVMDFDGVNDNLTIGSDVVNCDGSNFTWFILFKSDNSLQNGANIINNAYTETYPGITSQSGSVWGSFLNTNDAYYSLARSSTAGFIGRNVNISGTEYDGWHLVTTIWNGDTNALSLWFDGEFVSSLGNASAQPSGHVRTRIGSSAFEVASNFFNGKVAELRIYNEVLGDVARAEIDAEIMGTYLVPEPATIALLGLGSIFFSRRQKMIF